MPATGGAREEMRAPRSNFNLTIDAPTVGIAADAGSDRLRRPFRGQSRIGMRFSALQGLISGSARSVGDFARSELRCLALQRFVSIRDPIASPHHFPWRGLSSTEFRPLRSEAMNAWREIVLLHAVA